jgi:hypothetical protein
LTVEQMANGHRIQGFTSGATSMIALRNETQTRLMLLSPPEAVVPLDFQAVQCNPTRHMELLAEMQRLRGRAYLEDQAVQPSQLSRDGRHQVPIDPDSWHLLAVDSKGAICGCVRYYSHDNSATFRELWVRNSAIAHSPVWGNRLRCAVERELCRARLRNISYVEVGGWAIAPERRCSVEALRTAMATYCLADALGGCLGITTATVRHHSSTILRRIGGGSLITEAGDLPAYYDPTYGCEMEVLRFDSACPAPKYAGLVDRLRWEFLDVPIVCPSRRRHFWSCLPGRNASSWVGCPSPDAHAALQSA